MDKLYDRSGKPIPYRTSAGTEILASRNRSCAGVSFSYALPEHAFKEEFITKYRDVINQKYQTVAGRQYKPGTLKIVDIDATLQTEQLGEHGEGGDIRYWEISLSLVADPKTWWRDSLNVSTFFRPAPNEPLAQIWSTETVMKDKKNLQQCYLFDYYGLPLKNYESEEQISEVLTSMKHYGSRELMARFNQERLESITEPLFLFPAGARFLAKEPQEGQPAEWLPFQQPTLYGTQANYMEWSGEIPWIPGPTVDASGAILPFDRRSGRQFLGTYIHPNNGGTYSERWGYWRPVVVEIDTVTQEEYFNLVHDPDNFTDLEARMIYSTAISGYQSPLARFNELWIPKHKGYRWDDFSVPEEDEDQTA